MEEYIAAGFTKKQAEILVKQNKKQVMEIKKLACFSFSLFLILLCKH
ncbi:hypothetical protein PBCV1_a240bR [Paramecium bursaria Chlorella virus 1]|uniref:Uncharacterized protein n=1 Tax=Paramecium bursaria Chlorella virus 1 TaxID=10506 RepID=F8TU02_PBCV1|nr:hypothetical protein PBCV1_a240bR [Paramecium bursaria Chlorella virus 1]AEI70063.1 hypothetical protein [Paramecium bursaria Chlorella virus 1]